MCHTFSPNEHLTAGSIYASLYFIDMEEVILRLKIDQVTEVNKQRNQDYQQTGANNNEPTN